jgi:HTH-type transcriptional regulator/antitoxin HigA
VLALIVLLVEAFESQVREDDEDEDDETEIPAPHLTLQRLMQNHGIDVTDIAAIFGNPHLAREVLEGRRPISRGQAKELGRYFRVPAKLFHEE